MNKLKTHTIDVAGIPMGRAASQIAQILLGKNKTSYVPYKNEGDKVIVKNIKEIKFTGKKLVQKKYYHHTKYPGHLKTRKMGEVFEQAPAEVLKNAVIHMLPKNKLMKARMKYLTIL
jgi:large subunit ribosomal protein L13